jgi:hypothetical protein
MEPAVAGNLCPIPLVGRVGGCQAPGYEPGARPGRIKDRRAKFPQCLDEPARPGARNFVRGEFALKHRYALVLDTDEPDPHVHLVVEAVSEQGVRLKFRKATLLFAERPSNCMQVHVGSYRH